MLREDKHYLNLSFSSSMFSMTSVVQKALLRENKFHAYCIVFLFATSLIILLKA